MNRRQLLRATTALGAAGTLGGTAAGSVAAADGSAGAAAGPVAAADASARPAAGPAAGPAVAAAETTRPLRVHVVMFDGVEELDFAAPYEVFSAAAFFAPRPVDVRYVSASGARTVTAAYGTIVRGIRPWAPDEADVLVVPGGGYARRDSPGVWAEIDRGTLPRALAAAVRPGLTVSALCTGVMLLSAAGLTRSRPCTTHHKAKPDLGQQGGLLKDARVVDDGDLVTAGGVTSGLELALWLVSRELGPDAANSLETMLEYEARGTVRTSPRAD
ncbi:DJ-1/PfpI family protein [Streptomyces sp. NBC_00572]|uniref:DJ-1/PfpI family protein n=1 Tax=Streptomyces sp. NBC_00572 TaxID=2903664 RepID=UPI00224FA61E|nr:DJ-1/PfpI family protein [Streptomyces sp. NBC_00572]MCX4984721.1 DJ-1/PfpI family protein [Streptomyces sp. NBC_00572]